MAKSRQKPMAKCPKVTPWGLLACLVLTSIIFRYFMFSNVTESPPAIESPRVREPPTHHDRSSFAASRSGKFAPVWVFPHPRLMTGKSKGKPPQVNQDKMGLALTDEADRRLGKDPDRTPFFIDFGAHKATIGSNTYPLEEAGWNGVCVEANSRYWYDLRVHRRCAVIGALLGGTKDLEKLSAYLPKSGGHGPYGTMVDAFKPKQGAFTPETRYGVTTKTLLKEYDVPKVIDYASVDVEGAETLVFSTFPFDEYTIMVMHIERPEDDLIEMLMSHGYKLISIIADYGETLWIHESNVLTPKEAKQIAFQFLKFEVYDPQFMHWKASKIDKALRQSFPE
eukprot:Selendium_serpulae@DN4885_c0_g1_i2.p1